MVEAYCMKCKKKVVALNLSYRKTNSRNGMHIHQGTCPECGTKVSVFLKEKLN